MTDRELIRQIKVVYDPGHTDKGRLFVRRHEQRSLQLKDIIFDEFRFMSRKCVLPGMLLCLMLLIVSLHEHDATLWCLSSFLPLLALLITAIIGRSERYGMSELEAACRFSIRFVKTVRMLIIGTVSLILIFACTFIARKDTGSSFAKVMCFVSFPYLLNVFGNLFITRKWHSKEDLFLCAGATCFSCLVPSIAKALNLTQMSDAAAVILIIITAAAVTEESVKYIKEEVRIIWNW